MRTVLVLLAFILAGCSHRAATSAPLKFAATPKRVLIISVDGLRPDLLFQASAPNIHSLLPDSTYTFWALTVPDPYVYTLPSHVSMLTGVNPDRHGATWNEYIEDSYPEVPTIFDLAKAAGRSTAMATGKMKFIVFARPGSLDWKYLPPDEPVDDVKDVAAHAVAMLRDHRPDLLFVHFAGVDTVGHASGWGSKDQLAAVEHADQAVGLILKALHELKLEEDTLLIVSADHGGAGLTHGGEDPRSRTIPWIGRGPGLRAGYDLTRHVGATIKTYDTFATACVGLNLAIPPKNEGHAVQTTLRRKELLEELPATQPAGKP
jgi:predicted AlkP superfamily pyrophosphatase or phosphodiesterase